MVPLTWDAVATFTAFLNSNPWNAAGRMLGFPEAFGGASPTSLFSHQSAWFGRCFSCRDSRRQATFPIYPRVSRALRRWPLHPCHFLNEPSLPSTCSPPFSGPALPEPQPLLPVLRGAQPMAGTIYPNLLLGLPFIRFVF
ncbi:hypothetical protein BT67DRAFT_161724 [Trichocladium antarcticum]|uniref:Uncharacterized protein n=1 Tax=Trichocladium antarcticum TaxID=1450529 RepID=A0AAN6UGB5_9PEZI|nr:hypothetical protein BT67DRAFT_161724 [Trichocladium antarcticum]